MYGGVREYTPAYGLNKSANDYQNRDLRSSVSGLENRIMTLTAENEKLTLDLRDRYNDLQTWANRYDALEKNSQVVIEEYAAKLERQKQLELEDYITKGNSRISQDLQSLENQMKSLQGRIMDYENKIRLLNDENSRLQQITIERTAEADQWKVKYANLEKSVQSQMEDLRLSVELRTREGVDSVTREYSSRYLDEKRNYEIQLKSIRQAVVDLENKLRLTATDADRYNSLIGDKNNEINALKEKFINFERYKAQESQDLIEKLEDEKKEAVEREVRALSLKFGEERNRYETRIREISQVITELESQMNYLSSELERLQRTVEEKTRENDILKQEYMKLEQIKHLEYKALDQQFETLRKNALREADMDVKYQAERTALDGELMRLEHKVNELSAQKTALEEEHERLTSSYFELQREADSLRLNGRRNDNREEFELLKKENEKLRSLSLEANELRVRFDVEKQNYENQLAQLKQIVQANKNEIEKLYGLVDLRRQENEHGSKQLSDAREEISRLENACKDIEGRYMVLNNKYEQIGKEAQTLQKSRDLFRSQIERNNLEIAQKNRELLERIKEVDVLRGRYEDSINNIRAVSS